MGKSRVIEGLFVVNIVMNNLMYSRAVLITSVVSYNSVARLVGSNY